MRSSKMSPYDIVVSFNFKLESSKKSLESPKATIVELGVLNYSKYEHKKRGFMADISLIELIPSFEGVRKNPATIYMFILKDVVGGKFISEIAMREFISAERNTSLFRGRMDSSHDWRKPVILH